MKLSLEVDGVHYYEGDIVTVDVWNVDGEPVTYMGRISKLESESFILDYSYIYSSQTKIIWFENIVDIRK